MQQTYYVYCIFVLIQRSNMIRFVLCFKIVQVNSLIDTDWLTITLQQFLYTIKRINSKFFFFSLHWLKFQLVKLKLKNFNLIPSGTDEERPLVYRDICEKLKLFINKYDKNFFENQGSVSSKKMYEIIIAKKYYTPICERVQPTLDWPGLYKKVVGKFLQCDLRILNFRILNYGLSFDLKFFNKKKKTTVRCLACQRKQWYAYFVNAKLANCAIKILSIISFKFQWIQLKSYIIPTFQNKKLRVLIYKYTMWQFRNLVRSCKKNWTVQF